METETNSFLSYLSDSGLESARQAAASLYREAVLADVPLYDAKGDELVVLPGRGPLCRAAADLIIQGLRRNYEGLQAEVDRRRGGECPLCQPDAGEPVDWTLICAECDEIFAPDEPIALIKLCEGTGWIEYLTVHGRVRVATGSNRVEWMENWARCYDLKALGLFRSVNYGPNTYNHTEFFLDR